MMTAAAETDDWIEVPNDSKHAARERAKARELRASGWWKEQLARGICHYCGKKFPPEELTMDHIVPVARGGRSTRGNVVPACAECNRKKKYLTPVDMILSEMENKNAAPADTEAPAAAADNHAPAAAQPPEKAR